MRKFAFAFAALAFAAATHAASPPATEASIEALLVATKVDRTIEQTLSVTDSMLPMQLANALKGQQVTAAQQRTLDDFKKAASQRLHDAMQWATLRSDYIKAYQEAFTQQEVDALVAFYTSPAGAAYIEKVPALMQQSMDINMAHVKPVLNTIKADMAQTVEELNAKK